jgi:hypothetical protein
VVEAMIDIIFQILANESKGEGKDISEPKPMRQFSILFLTMHSSEIEILFAGDINMKDFNLKCALGA